MNERVTVTVTTSTQYRIDATVPPLSPWETKFNPYISDQFYLQLEQIFSILSNDKK